MASRKPSGTVRVVFEKNVKADDVHTAIDRLFGAYGCRGCGLMGFDVLLKADQVERLRELARRRECRA